MQPKYLADDTFICIVFWKVFGANFKVADLLKTELFSFGKIGNWHIRIYHEC